MKNHHGHHTQLHPSPTRSSQNCSPSTRRRRSSSLSSIGNNDHGGGKGFRSEGEMEYVRAAGERRIKKRCRKHVAVRSLLLSWRGPPADSTSLCCSSALLVLDYSGRTVHLPDTYHHQQCPRTILCLSLSALRVPPPHQHNTPPPRLDKHDALDSPLLLPLPLPLLLLLLFRPLLPLPRHPTNPRHSLRLPSPLLPDSPFASPPRSQLCDGPRWTARVGAE